MDDQLQILARRCLTHLKREEAVLKRLGGVIGDIRQALFDRDLEKMDALTDQQQKTSRSAEQLAAARNQLRAEIAKHARVLPEAATVSLLAERVTGPLRESLLEQRERVQLAALHVNQLVHANATLTSQLMELIEMVFRQLSGDPARLPCYEASGRTAIG
jgi:hypothetical protein